MKRVGFTVAKNAFANVMRGGASAIVALVLPHFLTRSLDVDRFAAWALMLQIAAYANYLDFGLQTAVARYLAQAIERRDDEQRDQLITTAFGMLSVGGVLAFLVIGVIVWRLPHIFHRIPASMMGDLQGGILILTASAALLLPLSTFTGILIGLHRNEYPALSIGGTRILGALAVLLAVHHTHSLLWLAVCIGGFNLIGGILQYIIAKCLLPELRLHFAHFSKDMAKELAHYCSVLTLFSIAMLMVSGLDVTIVAYFDFNAVSYYSISTTLIAFFSGLNGAIFSAFISPVAVLDTRREFGKISEIIVSSTRLNVYANISLTLITIFFGSTLLSLWVGREYAVRAWPILILLMLGQTVRLTGSAYSAALLAMGKQIYAIGPVFVEALSNLFLSLLGVLWLGPIGVAWGTLLAALFGHTSFVIYTIKKIRVLDLNRVEFVSECIIRPLICFLPLLFSTYHAWRTHQMRGDWVLWTLSSILSLLLALWKGQLIPTKLVQSLKTQLSQ